MKSRTSCFKTALKKDLTRFAPVWLLYTVCLLLGLLLMAEAGLELGLARAFPECIQLMSVVNLGYGLLTSQMLFGDLFVSRMCYGLHTLPMKREAWFASHALSGLLFSLIPTAIMTAVSLPLVMVSNMADAWQLPLYWLLAVNLEYIFFFGLGVSSMLLSGNRFGGALVYGIMNFAAILAYYVVDTVYTPMLYGVVTQPEPFVLFTPVVQFVEFPYITTETFKEFARYSLTGDPVYTRYGTFKLTSNWWYLWTCAGAGLVFAGLALLLYRRRSLERAGDLMGTKKAEPVFLVTYSLVCATVFQFFAMGIMGYDAYYPLLFVGLTVGFFTGRMLLKRTTRVFGIKSWLGFAALVAALGLTLLGTFFDILGLETRVPRAEDIRSVTVTQHMYSDREVELTAQPDIENVLYIHNAALESRLEYESLWYDGAQVQTVPVGADWNEVNQPAHVVLRYELKNGGVVTRDYYIWGHMPEGQLLKGYMSRLEVATGLDELTYAPLDRFTISGYDVPEEYWTRQEVESFLAAVRADCEAGTMAQDPSLHPMEYVLEYTSVEGEPVKMRSYWVGIGNDDLITYFDIFADSENTIKWIEDRGLDEIYAELMETQGG